MAYREDKPLTDLIPPDRRRHKTVALVAGGMLLGAGALYAVQHATSEAPAAAVDHPLTAKDVQDVVATKYDAVRVKCWRGRVELPHGDVTILATVGGDGSILGTTATGSNDELNACVEDEVKRWRFRATGGASVEVKIPFKFRRGE